jgi:hypothetical protein
MSCEICGPLINMSLSEGGPIVHTPGSICYTHNLKDNLHVTSNSAKFRG